MQLKQSDITCGSTLTSDWPPQLNPTASPDCLQLSVLQVHTFVDWYERLTNQSIPQVTGVNIHHTVVQYNLRPRLLFCFRL